MTESIATSDHGAILLEAGVRQLGEWGNTDHGRHILIAVVRYLAAHSPIERAMFQTADIARRLLRGGSLIERAKDLLIVIILRTRL